MHRKTITIWTFLILICSSLYGQSIEDVINYVKNQSGYKITSYSINVHGNYQNKDPKLLTKISISGSQISNLQVLDTFPKLNRLRLIDCSIDSLYNLPSSIQHLSISNGLISQIITIPYSVKELIFINNKATILPELPNTLTKLDIRINQLKSIDHLPDSLRYLDCSENQISSLPHLPSKLEIFRCEKNKIENLPYLPKTLKSLDCSFNEIKELNTLPSMLEWLYCRSNQITKIENLPDDLRELNLIDNPIKKLPKISKNCRLRISPTFLVKENDYRHLMLDYDIQCPAELENICQSIYRSFIDYDFNTFVSNSINLNDFYWFSPFLEGDSISKMNKLKELINKDIVNQENKDDFLTIAKEIDHGLLLLDSVDIIKVDSTNISPYKTYSTKFYFKRLGYDIPYKYLTVDMIDSPRGYLWGSFFSNLRDVRYGENKNLNKNPLPDNMPNDFEISVSYGRSYRFNSEQSVFIKGMTCNRAIAQVSLTSKEKEKIYSKLKSMSFNEFNEDMVKIRDNSHIPSKTISIIYNGKKKWVSYNCSNDCDTNEYVKLREFMETMTQILYKKRKVKKLPKIEFVYI